MSAGHESKLGKRYGRALFDVCAPEAFDTVGGQLASLANLWMGSQDFREVATNPKITDAQRASVLDSIVDSQMGGWKAESVKRVAHEIVVTRRGAALVGISETFAGLVEAFRRNLSLDVTTAKQLSEQEIATMRSELSRALGGEVKLSTHHDSSLLGGLTIRLGDKRLDRSVAGTLARLAQQLGQ